MTLLTFTVGFIAGASALTVEWWIFSFMVDIMILTMIKRQQA